MDGSPPGLGVYLRRLSVTVLPDHADLLDRLGEGNKSAGVRALCEFYYEMTIGSQKNLARGEELFRKLGL